MRLPQTWDCCEADGIRAQSHDVPTWNPDSPTRMNTELWFILLLSFAVAAGFAGGWRLARPCQSERAKQRLAQALEDMNIPLAVWDREDTLIACNAPFRAMYSEIDDFLRPGVTYTAMNKRYYRLGKPEVIGGRSEREFLYYATRRRSGPQLTELTRKRNDRVVLLLDYRNESGAIVSLRLDVTEQRAEATAAQAGRQFRDDLLELSDDYYWQMDQCGRITQFATCYETTPGFDCSRFVGRTLRELPGFSADEQRLEQFERALREQRPTTWLRARVIDDRSAPVWLMFRARPMQQADGTTAGYHGWARDISATETSLAAIRENESRLRQLAVRETGWYWETDADLRVSLARGGWMDRTGSEDSVRGRHLWQLNFDGETPAGWSRALIRIEKRMPLEGLHVSLVTPSDGTVHVFELHGLPRVEDGRFIGYRGFAWDVTATQTIVQGAAAGRGPPEFGASL